MKEMSEKLLFNHLETKNHLVVVSVSVLALLLLFPTVASPLISYTATISMSILYNSYNFFVDNNLSNLDSLSDKGLHSNFTAQQYGPDSIYDTLTEQTEPSGSIEIEDYVDSNLSDVDSSADIGSHSDFSSQQTGPDFVYDTLTEQNTGASSNSTLLDDGFEDFIWDTNWNAIPSNWVEDTFPVHSGSSSARAADFFEGYFTSDSLDASDAGAIYVDFWFRKTGTDAYDFTLYYYDGSSYDLIEELDDNGFDNTWLHYSCLLYTSPSPRDRS